MAYDSLFRSFPPFEWRSGTADAVQFPVTQMSISLQQDLAEHAFWGRDGERFEATGRKSLVFSATIPFRNGIVPGPNEKWGILYPDGWNAFVVSCAKGATGTLGHPTMGYVSCKVRSMETRIDATKRDGVDVEVTWVETIAPDDRTDVNTLSAQSVSVGALSLDVETSAAAIKGSLTAKGLLNQNGKKTLLDLANSVAAIGDQAALGQLRAFGKVEKALAQVQKIDDAFQDVGRFSSESVDRSSLRVRQLGDRGKSVRDLLFDPTPAAAAETVLAWPVREQAVKLENRLYDLRKELLTTGQSIGFYRVPKTMTLAGLIPATKARVQDLMRLNPGIASRPLVPGGVTVRYYLDDR